VYRIFVDPKNGVFNGFCNHLEASLRLFPHNKNGVRLLEDEMKFRRCDLDSEDDLSGALGWVASFTMSSWPGEEEINANNELAVTNAITAAMELSHPGTVIDWMEQVGCYKARGLPPRIDY
jgi:hypothetical protein